MDGGWMESVLVIDEQVVPFVSGQTIIEAAAAMGVDIPTLCYWKEADHTDFCRICVVEVEGSDLLLPACSTVAQAGMRIRTKSERVVESRRTTVKMLLSSGRHDCISCEASGDCVLQSLAYSLGIESSVSAAAQKAFPSITQDPFIIRDFEKCVLCSRCVAACSEVQVHNAIPDPFGRRRELSAPDGWFPVQDPDRCVDCGQCVDACPVGALTEKKAKGLARTWETTKVRTTCPYCGVGCQQLLHVKGERITKVTAADGAPNKGRLCVKGRFAYDFIYSKDRFDSPLIKEKDGFRKASWDEALDLVARRLTEIGQKHGPDSIAGVSCARALNEDSYNMQKFFRSVIGTNNIDHCART
jgi:predicted molibdopterin-dependent oxidoreductase YjgC